MQGDVYKRQHLHPALQAGGIAGAQGFSGGAPGNPGGEPGIVIQQPGKLHANGVVDVLFPQAKAFRPCVDPLGVVPLVDENADGQRNRLLFDTRFSVCPAGKNVKPAGPSFFCHIGGLQ